MQLYRISITIFFTFLNYHRNRLFLYFFGYRSPTVLEQHTKLRTRKSYGDSSLRAIGNDEVTIFGVLDFFILILLSRKSDGGAMHRTNPDLLKSCPCFRVFRLNFASDVFNLLLVTFHQAEIIVVKHLILGRNHEAWVGVEPSTLRSWPS